MDHEVSFASVAAAGDDYVKEALMPLSFSQLERLRKFSGVVLEEKYDRNHRGDKYGNLPRHFSRRQIVDFFSAITNDCLRVEFLVLLVFGLRVSELDDLVWLRQQGLLRVNNVKCRRFECIPVPECAESVLRRFFSQQRHSTKKLRYYFRKVCVSAGDEFTFVYGQSTHEQPRDLYQFTTHSLRHSAGNLLLRSTDNPYKVAVYLRHKPSSKFGVTATYMHYSLDEMRDDLEKTFENLIDDLS